MARTRITGAMRRNRASIPAARSGQGGRNSSAWLLSNAMLLVWGLGACKPLDATMHGAVASLTYGEAATTPPPDHELYLYSLLKPTLVRRYKDCRQAIEVLRTRKFDDLVELGKRLNKTSDQSQWVSELAWHWEGFAKVKDSDPMIPLAVGETAARAAAYVVTLQSGHRAINEAGKKTLKRLIHQTCQEAPRLDAPSLALSGGSANGAFIAGFLFELFLARERTARDLVANGKSSKPFLRSSRFSAAVGTSIGSLIAQILDLYATEKFKRNDLHRAIPELRKEKKALGELTYEKDYPPISRQELAGLLEKVTANQDSSTLDDAEFARLWALALLFEHFNDLAEPEAICVQSGSLVRTVGDLGLGRHHPGLMRFDPLQRNVMDPFLKAVGVSIASNGFPRVAVSVETSQNVTIGLHDSVCLMTADVAECLAGGAMASTVLPFFAQPVNRIYTGLSEERDCGIWLDGGLRSGLPLERALMLTRPVDKAVDKAVDVPVDKAVDVPVDKEHHRQLRVLAISTDRATGLPSLPTHDQLIDIAGEAIGEMGNQVQVSEAEYVSQFVLHQQERWRCIQLYPSTPPAPEKFDCVAASAAEQAQKPTEDASPADGPYVRVVFVPQKVPTYFVASAGYRFDPIVMRSLFAYGRLEAIDLARGEEELLSELHWHEKEKVLAYLKADRGLVEDWLSQVERTFEDKREGRRQEGLTRFKKRVLSCVEAPTAEEAPLRDSPHRREDPPPYYFGGKSPECRPQPKP